MTTADRVLAVLQLFTMDEPQWTIEDAARRLEIPTSTAYRYFRSLVEAGLLVNFAAGRYVIGPAIIELDRQTRHFDPLIQAAAPTMRDLARRLDTPGLSLLCRLYRRTVICVDQGADGQDALAISYERGRPMPLWRGAPSKSIMAFLPARTLRRYFEEEREAVRAAGLGDSWEALKARMRQIRKDGLCVTAGELDAGRLGISAPVFAPDRAILGSIGVVVVRDQVGPALEARLVERVREAGDRVTGALREHVSSPAGPPGPRPGRQPLLGAIGAGDWRPWP